LLFILFWCIAGTLKATGQPGQNRQDLSFTDPKIQTVLFFSEGWEFSLPVMELGTAQRLICKFDHLTTDTKNYYYTILHCDADWRPSRVVSSEYMEGFSENQVYDYNSSVNTTIPYVNYRITLPNEQVRILISGNYLLKVWEDGNKEKPALVRQFYVSEKMVELSGEIQRATYEGFNGASQQVAFAVNHPKLIITDPLNEIKTVVMQNSRRDNRLTRLKPTYIRQNQLVYEDKANLFKGGNEFRNFDAKSLQINGMGVHSIEYHDPLFHINLSNDRSTRQEIYRIRDDLNGNRLIKNDRAGDSDLESDYMEVHFALTPPDQVTDDDIYVFGALSDWQCKSSNHMTYNPETKLYEANILLKQGFYDYQYAIYNKETQSIDATFLEGSHLATENDYHIFVYYRPFSARYDRLIGYRVINSVRR
ncbi:MAG TPA: DUF5103 domain-containing protein, partial [Prolixibacteraceae bacterium]|nr:DUF5103 domain-containing protein [Prolixibacteraceae bacterium]